MKILYGNLQNDGIYVYIDENNDLFIADDQNVLQYQNTQENITRLIEEAKELIRDWNSQSK